MGKFRQISTELWPLIDIRNWFSLSIFGISLHIYTPGIYADGYIVFAFPFVCMFVSSFVLPSRSWNLRQSFASKFLMWCISQQLLIRKHSYLDHSYP